MSGAYVIRIGKRVYRSRVSNPSAYVSLSRWHAREVRRFYRRMRQAGIHRWECHALISNVLCVADLCVWTPANAEESS